MGTHLQLCFEARRASNKIRLHAQFHLMWMAPQHLTRRKYQNWQNKISQILLANIAMFANALVARGWIGIENQITSKCALRWEGIITKIVFLYVFKRQKCEQISASDSTFVSYNLFQYDAAAAAEESCKCFPLF